MDEKYSIFKDYMDKKTSNELLEIIKQDNNDNWSIEAFQAANEILKERGIKVPQIVITNNNIKFQNEKLGRLLERTYNLYENGIDLPFITAFEKEFKKKVQSFKYFLGIIPSKIFTSLSKITELENFESDEIIYDFYYNPGQLILAKSPYLITNKRILISKNKDFSEDYIQIYISKIKSFKLSVKLLKLELEFKLDDGEIISQVVSSFPNEEYINSIITKSEFITNQINTQIYKTQANTPLNNIQADNTQEVTQPEYTQSRY